MRFWNTAPNHLRTNVFKQQSRLTDTWVRHPERSWEVGEDGSDLYYTAQRSCIGPLAYDSISKRKRWLQSCIPVELQWEWYCWGAWTKSRRVFEFLNRFGLRTRTWDDQVCRDVLCKHVSSSGCLNPWSPPAHLFEHLQVGTTPLSTSKPSGLEIHGSYRMTDY